MAGSRFEVKRPARRRLPVLGAFVIAVGVSGSAFEHTSASPSLPMNGVLSAGHHAAPAKPANAGGSGGGTTSNVASAQVTSASVTSSNSTNAPTPAAKHHPPNNRFTCTWTDNKGHTHKFNDNDNGKYDQLDEPCDPNAGTSTEPPQKPLPPHSCTYTKTTPDGRTHTKIYHDHDPNNPNGKDHPNEPCEPSGDQV